MNWQENLHRATPVTCAQATAKYAKLIAVEPPEIGHFQSRPRIPCRCNERFSNQAVMNYLTQVIPRYPAF